MTPLAVHYSMRRVLLLSLVPVLLAGCAIDRKPLRQSTVGLEEMDSAANAQVARGQVSLGYTPAMVERALGEPAKIKAKASGNSIVATWIYPGDAGRATEVTFRQGQVSSIRHDK